MAQFEPGNSVGEATRFRPGTSGNPGGRPKGLAHVAHKVMQEAAADCDYDKAEAVMRRLYDLAMSGSVPAIKLIMDREWPAPNRHEIKNDVPLVRLVDYTGRSHEAKQSDVDQAAKEFNEEMQRKVDRHHRTEAELKAALEKLKEAGVDYPGLAKRPGGQ